MQPQRPRAKYTTEVGGRLREETGNQRTRLLQALNAINNDLPREAGGLLDAAPPPGHPNCFVWSRVFLDQETLWRLDCIVSKIGWPNLLWVIAVFASDGKS